MNREIYTSKIKAGRRTYFFDIRETSKGSYYLEITESKSLDDGKFERHSIMIFDDDILNIKNELNNIYDKFFSKLNSYNRKILAELKLILS